MDKRDVEELRTSYGVLLQQTSLVQQYTVLEMQSSIEHD